MTQSTFDYPHHFNNHVIDWYLWNELQLRTDRLLYGTSFSMGGRRIPPWEVIIYDSEDWTRYDGELL